MSLKDLTPERTDTALSFTEEGGKNYTITSRKQPRVTQHHANLITQTNTTVYIYHEGETIVRSICDFVRENRKSVSVLIYEKGE